MAKHLHDLLPFFVNGQLPTAERIAVEQHVLTCEECRTALDEWRALADAVRADTQARAHRLPPLTPQLYRAQQEPATAMPSTSSRRKSFLRKWNIEEYVTIRRPSARMEEDTDMNATSDVSFVPARPLQFPETRKLMFDPITWVAAILVMIVLGALLLFMRASFNPGAGGAPEEAIPEFAAQPEGCAVETADAQAESVRLAGEATALLEAEGDNSELALLGICALQTAYTSEADVALQQALTLEGALQQFEGHTYFVTDLEYSPDGQYLYSVSLDMTMRVWNAQSGDEMTQYQIPPSGYAMALSPDGRYLVIDDPSGQAKVWDIQTGEVDHTFSLITGDPDFMAFSSDGKYLATVSVNNLILWDFATGEELQTYDGDWGAISPDGRYVAVFDGGQLQFHDVETGESVRTFEVAVSSSVYAMTFTRDSRYLILGGGVEQNGSADNSRTVAPTTILVLDTQTGAEVHRLVGHNGEIGGIAVLPNDNYVLTSTYDGTARLWDMETGNQLRIFTADEGEAVSVAVSPDGRYVAAGYESGLVKMWPADYHDMIALACEHVTSDFTDEERVQYGLGAGPACP